MIDSSGSEFRNAEVRTESGRALRCSRLHLRVFGDVIGDGQLAISTGPLGVDRTLGNALAVLVRKPLLGTCCKRGELAVVISAISNGLWNTWFSLRRGPAIASAWSRRNVRQTAGSDTPTANDRRNLLIAQRRADDVHSDRAVHALPNRRPPRTYGKSIILCTPSTPSYTAT